MRESEYFDVLCNTADAVYIVDAEKHIVRWNKGAEKLFKYAESDVLNRECHQVIGGKLSVDKTICSENCKIHSGVQKGTPQRNFDIWTHTSEGELIWLNISIISPPDTNSPFLAHILRDVTKEKKTGLALDRFISDLGNNSFNPLDNPEAITNRPSGENGGTASNRPAITLSNREIEVLTLLAEGLSTKGLAEKLEISHFTARNHIQNILVKLNLHSKAQAVSYAFKKGIL
jgi:PAS domain S-box-containing protein